MASSRAYAVAMLILPCLVGSNSIACGGSDSREGNSGEANDVRPYKYTWDFTPTENKIVTAKTCQSIRTRVDTEDQSPYVYCEPPINVGDPYCSHCEFLVPNSGLTSTWTALAGVTYQITVNQKSVGAPLELELACESAPTTTSATTTSATTATTTTTTTATTTTTTATTTTATTSTATTVTSVTSVTVTVTTHTISTTSSSQTPTSSVTTTTTVAVESSNPSVESTTSASTSAEVGGCMTLSSIGGGGGNLRAFVAAYRQAVAEAAGVDVDRVDVELKPGEVCTVIDQSRRRLQDGEQVAMYFVIRFDTEEAAAQARNILTANYPSEVSRIFLEKVSNDPSLGQVSVISDLVVGSVGQAEDPPAASVWDGGRTAAIVVGALFLSCILVTAFVAYNKYKGKAAPKTEETAGTAEVQEFPGPEGFHNGNVEI